MSPAASLLVALLSAAPTSALPTVDFELPAPAVSSPSNGHVRYEYRGADGGVEALVELMAPRPCEFGADVCGEAYARAVAISAGGSIVPTSSKFEHHDGTTLVRHTVVISRGGTQVGLYQAVVLVQGGWAVPGYFYARSKEANARWWPTVDDAFLAATLHPVPLPPAAAELPAGFDFSYDAPSTWKKIVPPGDVFTFFRCPDVPESDECHLTVLGPVLMDHDDFDAKWLGERGGSPQVKKEGPFPIETHSPFRTSMVRVSDPSGGTATFRRAYIVDVNGMQMTFELMASTPESLEAHLPALKGVLRSFLEKASGKSVAQGGK